MRKAARRIVVTLGVFIGLLVLAVVCVGLFFDVNRYKPQIEAAAAKSTGMDLKINGKIRLKILPSTRIVLNDVHLRNRGTELLTAKTIEATPNLFAYLFHHEIKFGKISLDHPRLNVEKSAAGRMNYEASRSPQEKAHGKAGRKSETLGGAGNIRSIEVTGADLNYVDHSTQDRIQAKGVNVQISGIAWAAQNSGDQSSKNAIIKSISFHGTVDANSVSIGKTQATNLKAKLRANNGLIQLDSTDLTIFGGTVAGNGQADFRGKIPKWTIDQKATQLDLSQVSEKTKGKVSGLADATLKLSAIGSGTPSITRSLDGNVTVQSQNIQLQSAKLEQLSMITKVIPDLGAMFSDSSKIQKLFMNWTIKNGIAHATDVACSTPKGKVAARGEINLANRTFQNFYIAPVNDQGCSERQVQIAGTFSSPHPEIKSIGEQIARSEMAKVLGPQGSQLSGIMGGDKSKDASGCDHFYTGSLVRSGGK